MTTTTTKEISIHETARRLRVSIKFVRDLVWEGKLPARKLGRQWQVDAGAVEERRKRLSVSNLTQKER